ncbi:MAG TPA: SCO family protein, partial [Steroidobacteraceae bacterium]|nr:SCO family protein [Steroidobacteraceae bacterium]
MSIITCSLALLAGCNQAPKFKGTDITGADYGKSLRLNDPTGRPRSLEDFRGKAVVLFFGYTHCPDVCPTTLADLAGVMKSLGPQADRVQVLFVTVDPERDTPEALSKYVGAFDPRFIALRGDEDATQRAAKE